MKMPFIKKCGSVREKKVIALNVHIRKNSQINNFSFHSETLEKEKQTYRYGGVIPALWETEKGGSPEVRSSRPAWPTW